MQTIEQVKEKYYEMFNQYPNNQIKVITNFKEKTYSLEKTNEIFESHPEVPIFTDLKVIYGDTDSIFVRFKYNLENNDINRQNTFKYADECSKQITRHIGRKPLDLEFEKIFQPLVLLTKKRYIAKKFEDSKNPFKSKCIDMKGIALVRRDYCGFVKKCYGEITDEILNNTSSIADTVEIYKKYLKQLEDDKVEMSDLTLSALLKSNYKSKPIHVYVSEKMRARNEEVAIGDRIPFVFIENGNEKKTESGEHPKFVMDNNIPLKKSCYVEQLAKPILGFYKCIMSQKDFLKLLDYTNEILLNYNGKKLTLSSFKLDAE